jgi:hypothetical protein
MLPYVKAAGGGVVGGIVGALIWAGIGYAFHREIGWIAWSIGGLVGLGVRFAAQDNDGYRFGIIAVVVAVLSIVAGKYLTVTFIVSSVQSRLDDVTFTFTDDDMIKDKAEEVVAEWRAKGKQVTATNNPSDFLKKNYSSEVQNEAKRRWYAIALAERQRLIAAKQVGTNDEKSKFSSRVRFRVFSGSFSPWDILWVVLATVTAFKLGAGMIAKG